MKEFLWYNTVSRKVSEQRERLLSHRKKRDKQQIEQQRKADLFKRFKLKPEKIDV